MARYDYDDGTPDLTADACDDVADWENIPPDDAATQAEVEDLLLASIAIDQMLEHLTPRDRAVIELLYAYRVPPNYTGPWRPEARDVSRYIGERFSGGQPVPISTLWAWHDAVLARWQRQRRLADACAAFETLGLSLIVCPPRRRAA